MTASSPLRAPLCLLLVATLLCPAWAWGPRAHRAITRLAVSALPSALAPFTAHSRRLLQLCNEPDRWRQPHLAALNGQNAFEHFINLEWVPPMTAYPPDRAHFQRLLNRSTRLAPVHQAALSRIGVLPYAVAETYDKLVVAFEDYRLAKLRNRPLSPSIQDAVQWMGLLSHYAGDGSQPLHTTINYDGWRGPNPAHFRRRRGIHALFETTFAGRALDDPAFRKQLQQQMRPAHPYSGDVLQLYWQHLYQVHAAVPELYRLNQQRAFAGDGTPAGRAFLQHCLLDGAQTLANLYLTAWRQSRAMLAARAQRRRYSHRVQ